MDADTMQGNMEVLGHVRRNKEERENIIPVQTSASNIVDEN